MAKRYYQDKKDRMDESKGMKKRMGDDYSGKMKKMGGSAKSGTMTDETFRKDYSAPANMPQEVMRMAYPRNYMQERPELGDNLKGIDMQINDDAASKQIKRGDYPDKF